MSLVQNEQTKLLASALDRASTVCFTIGVAGPVAAILFDVTVLTARPYARLAGLLVWFLAAVVLHLLARAVLTRLEP